MAPTCSFSRVIYALVSILLLSACSSQEKPSPTKAQASVDYDLLLTLPQAPVSYQHKVKPLLERRCVVCHGCYDAPCQLKLSSIEGIQRGASKQLVYDGLRIRAIEPTRLFTDAKTTSEWRQKQFYTVLNEGHNSPGENLENSTLYKMLRLKQQHPQPRVGMLPDSFDLALDRKQFCPKPDEFEKFSLEHPGWGMPYGLPNLEDEEYKTLVHWLAQGVRWTAITALQKTHRNRSTSGSIF